MVQAILAADPGQPTIEGITRLVNQPLLSLLEPLGRVLQLECVQDGSFQAWRVLTE